MKGFNSGLYALVNSVYGQSQTLATSSTSCLLCVPCTRRVIMEIVFLRSITPSHYPHVDSPEIVYDIQEGNIQNSFDIVKRFEHGMIVGVVRQVKPLIGPLSTVLKLAMNYVTNGVISHRNIINVHIYVSEFWF
ncbi:Fibulin-1 [Bagarius yarrelli]|uniref:Fibulin-1 n=1 Tax=Bagarius yarrelli TaxID=175774 RepID=A0A556THW4_BAGYA|nr:Fibulin-1 [Bagarius yarrelli]